MNSHLKGTGVAIVTPFHKDSSIDFNALEKLVNHIIKGGVDYLVVLGTTGESVTLSKDEKIAIVNHVIEITGKRVPVVLGLGGNNTQEVLNCVKMFDFDNIEAILSVSPYYNKPIQEGIFRHYQMIAGVSPVPVILYNVPGRTGSNITSETTLRLAEVPNIIGIKEASGNLEQAMHIINNRPKGFLVISGDDALTLPLIACGGDGVISVVANAFPKLFTNMVKASLKGDFELARKNHYKLLNFTEFLFTEGNPGGIKAALKVLGITHDHMRLPLYNVSKKTFQNIENEVVKLK
ncbi:MAG: 4-hydroxy-tetrahydrodipicolinate synthase [Bacteroidetes bacterium]|nr:4-hydroxy-tetrahydrodipicolinate synthase [Bacteroidota bacterium]HET6244282.1 4-hydroxy-tetrahydrodipicolinate synthase [Bacteroidia bacterium]